MNAVMSSPFCCFVHLVRVNERVDDQHINALRLDLGSQILDQWRVDMHAVAESCARVGSHDRRGDKQPVA